MIKGLHSALNLRPESSLLHPSQSSNEVIGIDAQPAARLQAQTFLRQLNLSAIQIIMAESIHESSNGNER